MKTLSCQTMVNYNKKNKKISVFGMNVDKKKSKVHDTTDLTIYNLYMCLILY